MSNAPFILTLDCDMYANNCEALREAMCFFMDPPIGHHFAFVQFPQRFNGISKNYLYANLLRRYFNVGMLYGCVVEDVLTGYSIHCRGWKSVFCSPKRDAFLGCAPVNLNDTLTQIKRWATGLLEIFASKFCPLTYGIRHTKIVQNMSCSFCFLWALHSLPLVVYGSVPALSMLSGLSLFPQISDPWILLFVFLSVSAYASSVVEYICVGGGTFKDWWNEQRMWMIKGVSSYLFALIQVFCKLLGIAKMDFEVTSKVLDSEVAKRYEEEIFEFGVASALFIPFSVTALINLIALVGGIVRVMTEGNAAIGNMFVQVMVSSFIVLNSRPIYGGMVVRKDKGRMPTSITLISTLVALFVCSLASALS